MNPLNLTGLLPLMAITTGIPDIVIGLIDGPVASMHPELNRENLRGIQGRQFSCSNANSIACRHGTFIAGILNARRIKHAPALCPGCTLLVRPVFLETEPDSFELPAATSLELASAIIECIEHGARIINLSVALEEPSPEGDRKLRDALDMAADNHVIVVAAAGNQGRIGGSVLTRHPWVIPVVACDVRGKHAVYSNLTESIGRRGLMAPGDKIISLGTDQQRAKFGGTSTAAAFVTGAIALLWSAFPRLSSAQMKSAITGISLQRRRTVIPPLLDAWKAYHAIRGQLLGAQLKKYKRKAA